MTLVVGVITVLGIVGPVANARLTRNDRLISNNLSQVQQAITDYTTSNTKLPADLSSLKLVGDTKKLVDTNLVTYKPNTKPATSDPGQNSSNYNGSSAYPYNNQQSPKTYYYQLCVSYKKASNPSTGSYSPPVQQTGDNYQSYVTTDPHPAGEVCYKLTN